eukprot:g8698.t2
MELEFPHEQWSDTSARQYQFMSGPFFLVAPVFRNETKRSVPILLPSGEWIDYSDGITRYQGPATLNAYNCPLDQLPVFVQAGAIVPMWPSLNFVGEKPVNELTLDLFPPTSAGVSNFTLYEDDGLTRNYRSSANGGCVVSVFGTLNSGFGAVATQIFEMRRASNGSLEVCIGPSIGAYAGKISSRSYRLQVHLPRLGANAVKMDGRHLPSEELCGEQGSSPGAWRWPESGGVVCDVGARMAWEHEIRAAEAKSRPSSSSWTSGSSSSWSFEFRSYTNQEELNAMLPSGIAFAPSQSNVPAGECEDNFLLLAGLLQLKIRWRGTSVSPSGGKFPLLRWDSSEAILSSSLFPWQRTFDRPEAAERLRKDPWQLVAMVEVEVDGQRRLVAVVNRMGAGRLVFSEDS